MAKQGDYMSLKTVSEVRRGDNVVDRFPTRVINERICSDEALMVVRECLEETARTGTAKQYFRDTLSFRVAGKTGTAKFAQSGIKYSDGYYLGTMVVYFPADNPKYTVMTAIHTDRRRGRAYYGASLAGPVVRDVVNYIYYREDDWHQQLQPSTKEHHPLRIKGGNIAQVRKVADKFSPRVSFTDREGWGVASTDTLLNVDIKSITDPKTMPNVVGMGLKDALYILESRGLKVSFSGKGMVRSQSIRAGEKISAGKHVTITLK